MSAYRHGNTFRAHSQFLRAAAQHDNAIPPEDPAAEARQEAIDAMLADEGWLARHIPDADSWCDGMFSGRHYSAVERALADLGALAPDRVAGSAELAEVLRLAAMHAAARERELVKIAAQQRIDWEDEQEEMRGGAA